MSSPEADIEREDVRQNKAGVGALLDSAFGYFLWAAHFLLVYVTTAVSCQLGLATAGSGIRGAVMAGLALVTVGAATIVVLHALRRYRQLHDQPNRRFLMTVTIGNNAVATVAIVWQLLALTLVPICA